MGLTTRFSSLFASVLTLLLVVSCGAAADMTSFRSPQGVSIVRHQLMFTDVGRPHGFCQNVTFEESEVYQDSRLWPYSALKSFGVEVYKHFRDFSTLSPRALRYQDAEAKANPGAVTPLEFITSCIARRMILDRHTVSEAMCVCLSGLAPENQCSMLDAFARKVSCLDSAAAKIDSSLFCPSMIAHHMGVHLSESCSGSIAGGISAQALDLYSLNIHAPVPDMIDPQVVAQEGRTYYLANKALDKLGRWTDAHLFCKSVHYPDLELLPTWESRLYFYVHSAQAGYIPLAVLAQRENNVNATRNFERFLLVIRDARTTLEAQLAGTTRLARRLSLTGLQGLVHAGYDTAAAPIIAAVSARLTQFFTENSARLWEPRLTVIGGGSFGSGVATIVARDLGRQFEFATGTRFRVQHDLIVFESGGVGNYEFNEDLRRAVNIRNIVSEFSPLSNFPCLSPAGCNRLFAIRTGESGEMIGPFFSLPGRVKTTTEELGSVWATKAQPVEVVANAVCATSCWMTSTFCLDDPEPTCTAKACGAFFTAEAIATSVA